MENLNEAKNLISEAKNIYIIPSGEYEPDSMGSALALFYTLKETGKNVNLIVDSELPDKLKFLIPSLNHISYPKNFVISIPNKAADISQIYYEKDDTGLKIHLAVNKGIVKKENVSFYFSDAKPDLIITLGVKDFVKELSGKLDSYGFLLDSSILNIDNVQENKNFGKINLIQNSALAETALQLVGNPHGEQISKEAATCFLTGIIAFTENFKNNVTANVLETAAMLMKKGADLEIIKNNLFK